MTRATRSGHLHGPGSLAGVHDTDVSADSRGPGSGGGSLIIRPTIGGWEPPRVESIATVERRRSTVLPVVGLSGDLQQDLGRGAIAVEIVGSLFGDEARDTFLAEVRERFQAGEPVDFVADIVNEAELEQVLIEALELTERREQADTFRYRIVLREYTEPPEPPGFGLGDDFGLGLDDLLDLDALAGLDLLDLAGLLGDVPDIGDLLSPVQTAAAELKETLGGASELLSPLSDLLD